MNIFRVIIRDKNFFLFFKSRFLQFILFFNVRRKYYSMCVTNALYTGHTLISVSWQREAGKLLSEFIFLLCLSSMLKLATLLP